MGRRWHWTRRSAAAGKVRARQAPQRRCPEEDEARLVDLIDLARPPRKLVPLENLLPPEPTVEPPEELAPGPRTG